MHEVIIERPRRGSRSVRYPRARLLNRGSRGGTIEDAPLVEGMGSGYRDKHLNENLAPLLHFLKTSVGRPWRKVHSEIAANLSVGSAVQKHVLDHLRDFVMIDTFLEDGKIWGPGPYGAPRPIGTLYYTRVSFYVDPRSGLLRQEPKRARRKLRGATSSESNDVKSLGPWKQLRRIGGHWFEIDLAPLPITSEERKALWDVVAKCYVATRNRFTVDVPGMEVEWYSGRYARSRRQLSQREVVTRLGRR